MFIGTMSVFMGTICQCPHDMSVFKVRGQCSWPPQSVFMVHVVSIHGHHVRVHYNII